MNNKIFIIILYGCTAIICMAFTGLVSMFFGAHFSQLTSDRQNSNIALNALKGILNFSMEEIKLSNKKDKIKSSNGLGKTTPTYPSLRNSNKKKNFSTINKESTKTTKTTVNKLHGMENKNKNDRFSTSIDNLMEATTSIISSRNIYTLTPSTDSMITAEKLKILINELLDYNISLLNLNYFNFKYMTPVEYTYTPKEDIVSENASLKKIRVCVYNYKKYANIAKNHNYKIAANKPLDSDVETIYKWGREEVNKLKNTLVHIKQVSIFTELMITEIKKNYMAHGKEIAETFNHFKNIFNKKEVTKYENDIGNIKKNIEKFNKDAENILLNLITINSNCEANLSIFSDCNDFLHQIKNGNFDMLLKRGPAIHLMEMLEGGLLISFKTISENTIAEFNNMENVLKDIEKIFISLESSKKRIIEKLDNNDSIKYQLPNISKYINNLNAYKSYINDNRFFINSITNIIEIPKHCNINNRINGTVNDELQTNYLSELKPKAIKEYKKLYKTIGKLPVYKNNNEGEYRQMFYIFENHVYFTCFVFYKNYYVIRYVDNIMYKYIIDCKPLYEEDPTFSPERFVQLFINDNSQTKLK
ncbi:hypothetical protein TCON_2540 [Astathelohania contejeani]|uniref:Uncharacterized protein n=1 Tax=Astathelohania contejeani TaxID=164912 RepID=A0ABQ7HVT9_9MICR|nr:hypothetical protein TCON_2540 [Thelohania contejeani]